MSIIIYNVRRMRKLILSFLLLTATLTVNAQSNERALAAAL